LAQIAFDLLSIAKDRTVSTSEANQVFFLPLNNLVWSDLLPASITYTLHRDLLFYRPCCKRQHCCVLLENAFHRGGTRPERTLSHGSTSPRYDLSAHEKGAESRVLASSQAIAIPISCVSPITNACWNCSTGLTAWRSAASEAGPLPLLLAGYLVFFLA